MPALSSPILYWPLLLLAAYLLGSVPFSQVIARLKGVDLREVGTGNVGAGNLTKNVGLGWGIAAAILDGLKGLIPVWLALRSGLGPGASGLAGVAAVVGHNWSIFMRGRSGRGLATAFRHGPRFTSTLGHLDNGVGNRRLAYRRGFGRPHRMGVASWGCRAARLTGDGVAGALTVVDCDNWAPNARQSRRRDGYGLHDASRGLRQGSRPPA